MREKTLKIKGMRVPGLFIWLHGFFQGRITKTATVDEEDRLDFFELHYQQT